MAFDTFLFLDKIDGEASATIDTKPFGMSNKPFEIYSFSFGGSNPSTVSSGKTGLSAGKVSLSSFNVMKKTENASPKLFQDMCAGQHIAKASIIMRKATGTAGKQQVFLEYDFTDVMVDSIQWSGSSGGDDTPTESISFAFATVAIQYYTQDTEKGTMAKGNAATWDLTKVSA